MFLIGWFSWAALLQVVTKGPVSLPFSFFWQPLGVLLNIFINKCVYQNITQNILGEW